jgi:hypothetical protein
VPCFISLLVQGASCLLFGCAQVYLKATRPLLLTDGASFRVSAVRVWAQEVYDEAAVWSAMVLHLWPWSQMLTAGVWRDGVKGAVGPAMIMVACEGFVRETALVHLSIAAVGWVVAQMAQPCFKHCNTVSECTCTAR